MYKVTFVGLSKSRRDFGSLKSDLGSIKMTDSGNVVQRAARRFVPVLTGALRRSIKVLPSNRVTRVIAGVGLPPYAAVQERGRYHNIRPHYYMRRASKTNVTRAAKKDVVKLIQKSF